MTTTTNRSDHALLASTYLSATAEISGQGIEWNPDDGKLAYAQTIATIALTEAVLGLVAEVRKGIINYNC
jgi:hypothetical protein